MGTNAASATLAREGTNLRNLIGRFILSGENNVKARSQAIAAIADRCRAPARAVRPPSVCATEGNTALATDGWAEF